MTSLQNKKLLVIGGSARMIDLVETAKSMGVYTIVVDWNSVTDSPAKTHADEYWNDSIMDYNTIVPKAKDKGIDGVITCMTDSYLTPYRIISERLNTPCYLNEKTEKISTDKLLFKRSCQEYGIPVAKKYSVEINDDTSLEKLPYPIVVKPADGSGSRGFKVCQNKEDIIEGYNKAVKYSATNRVIIEDYMPYDSVIIHYTLIDGKCFYSGISDKISCKFSSSGSSVMGFQSFPSKGEKAYLDSLDEKVRDMFEKTGFRNGPVWIEAFYDGKEKFVFNEMGYRFGGSFSYYPVQYFYKVNQLEMLIEYAVTGDYKGIHPQRCDVDEKYCILPVHCKAGKIQTIEGAEAVKARKDVYAYAPKHFEDQEIKDWGTALQVFCYLHILYKDYNDLRGSLQEILTQLKAIDEKGDNMLYTLFDIETLTDESIS